jgi:hypothetical protein
MTSSNPDLPSLSKGVEWSVLILIYFVLISGICILYFGTTKEFA